MTHGATRRRRAHRRRHRRRVRGPLGHDDVGAAVEALDQLGEVLGLVGEVGLEHDDGVAARVARAARGLTAQGVDGRGVPDPRAAEHA